MTVDVAFGPAAPADDPAWRRCGNAVSLSFNDLVTAATVGVSRKPLPITDLDGPADVHVEVLDVSDPAASLLDAAALLTVAQRAGFRPAQAIARPSAASKDGAPELSPRAERALRLIGRAHLAPGFAAGDSELLADLLTAAGEAGYVSSAPLLPDLLDAAVRATALRPAVAAVLGVRGRWLAGHRSDWQRITDAVTVSSGDPEVWRTGSRSERHAYLAAQRQRDPKAGRELLAADWAQQSGDERAALLAVLVRGLSADDEEFLDAALDDRAAAVRGLARRLLTLLPGSRFSQRATERASAVLRLQRHGSRRTLVPSVPGDPDAAAVRDGIDTRRPSPSIGPGAWLLIQLIAAVPLANWTRLFGLEPATSWSCRSRRAGGWMFMRAGGWPRSTSAAASGPRRCSRSAILTTETGPRPPGRPTTGSRPSCRRIGARRMPLRCWQAPT